MNIAKQLARLNPKNVRFDVGPGGVPDLISTDIAAAVAFVEPGLGRELLCRTWWSAGAKLTAGQLTATLDKAIRAEWARREGDMVDAMLAVSMHGHRAQQQYADAHAARWPDLLVRRGTAQPALTPGYAMVREGVLAEISSAGLCLACEGRGEMRNDHAVLAPCRMCAGVGHHRMGERERAEAAGFKWTTFRDSWSPVYDWTFQHCAEALHRAERQFARALGD